MKKSNSLSRDILIFFIGVSLFLLSQPISIANAPYLSKILEAIGLAMAGYGPIQLIIQLTQNFRDRNTEKAIDKLFESSIRIVKEKEVLPSFIISDIEGCITPPYRTEVDLRKLQKLRQYCEFVKKNPEYPQLVIFTGRSQGYVELLAQTLNMLNFPKDLPFIIENGAALYHVDSKRTEPVVNKEQRESISNVRAILGKVFPYNEFEPKTYMVTINPKEMETIEELREAIVILLKEQELLDRLTITSTASAVDITPKGITKYSGYLQVLNYYSKEKSTQESARVVAIGDSISDLEVIKNVESGYCPAENVSPELRKFIEKKFGEDNVINLKHLDFVLAAIEKECGIKIK